MRTQKHPNPNLGGPKGGFDPKCQLSFEREYAKKVISANSDQRDQIMCYSGKISSAVLLSNMFTDLGPSDRRTDTFRQDIELNSQKRDTVSKNINSCKHTKKRLSHGEQKGRFRYRGDRDPPKELIFENCGSKDDNTCMFKCLIKKIYTKKYILLHGLHRICSMK
jgi:hypothetical protein